MATSEPHLPDDEDERERMASIRVGNWIETRLRLEGAVAITAEKLSVEVGLPEVLVSNELQRLATDPQTPLEREDDCYRDTLDLED